MQIDEEEEEIDGEGEEETRYDWEVMEIEKKNPNFISNCTSQATLSIADWPYKPTDWPYKPTRVFSACFVLTRTFIGKLPGKSPIPKLLQVKHA
jgi:hypothetical protein